MDQNFLRTIQQEIDLLLLPIVGGETVNFDILKEADQWRVNIITDKQTLLIGDDGEILHALQHILRVLVHKEHPTDRTHFIIDVNLYRQNREKILKEKARKIAEDDVLAGGVTLILVGLSSYERRLIHNILIEIDGLETISVGQGESRKLLIRPTTELGSKGIDNAKVINLFGDENKSLVTD